MKKISKAAGAALLILTLVQLTTCMSFAERLDLVWTLEPGEYDYIGGTAYESYRYDCKYGVIFSSGETHKYGIMDKYGKVLVPAEYDTISNFYADGYFQVYKDKKSAVIDSTGKAVIGFDEYEKLDKFNDSAIIAEKNGFYGLISPSNKVLIDFRYDMLSQMDISTMQASAYDKLCAYKDGKCGVVDMNGRVIIPLEHEGGIKALADGNLFLIGPVTGNRYIVNIKGETVVSGVSLTNTVSDGVISVTLRENGSNVYLDKDGNRLKDESYGKPKYIGEYYVRFETDKYYGITETWKRGLADKDMNILIPCQYYELEQSVYEDIFRVKTEEYNDSSWMYVDAHGNPVDYLNRYGMARLTEYGDVIGNQNGKYGMAQKDGTVIIPFEYRDVAELAKGLYRLTTTDGKVGLAEFGVGKKVNQTPEGMVLTIGSSNAKAFNKDVELDAAPVIKNDRTMLPIRFVAESLGAKVDWNSESRMVKITAEAIDISLVIGENTASVNGEQKELDSPSFIENNRTYLPVRFVAESLGAEVNWNGETKTVTITK